jgi:uncharacterized protein (TIGR02246 family)
MNKYVPIDTNEKEIIDTLGAYLEARNSNDTQNLAELFDEEGEYIAGDGTAMKGKDDIANSDPVWWTQYGKQKILNPQFHIDKSSATVSTTGKWGLGHRRQQTFYLIKRDGKWLILKVALDR